VLLILWRPEIGAEPLQKKILVKELEGIKQNRIGISEDLRNKICENLNGLTIDKLAQYAGIKNCSKSLTYKVQIQELRNKTLKKINAVPRAKFNQPCEIKFKLI
jgi:hypothetical protein